MDAPVIKPCPHPKEETCPACLIPTGRLCSGCGHDYASHIGRGHYHLEGGPCVQCPTSHKDEETCNKFLEVPVRALGSSFYIGGVEFDWYDRLQGWKVRWPGKTGAGRLILRENLWWGLGLRGETIETPSIEETSDRMASETWDS